jgi:hypothetical protein
MPRFKKSKNRLRKIKLQDLVLMTKERWYKKRICVTKIKEIRELILREAHDLAYSIHPGSTKMYHDLKSRYWWYEMKRAIAEYVTLCDNCQRVKEERQRPASLLQPLKIPEWKWEEISMDFTVGLPKTQNDYDSIWVIVDHLSKVAHFIVVKLPTKVENLQSYT